MVSTVTESLQPYLNRVPLGFRQGSPAAGCDVGEEGLIARAQSDPRAFAEIYELHYAAIASYVYRRTGDRDATEDLIAETFLIALREIVRFRWRGIPVRHWLYRIATHATNRWARRRRFFDLAGAKEKSVAGAPDRSFVHHALRRLPSRFQEVLSLHYLAGLPLADVARLLGIAQGTVKSRLARARDALRRRLEKEHLS
jgi:RNA polymerase sigma-70 factor (ECF subfamily)